MIILSEQWVGTSMSAQRRVFIKQFSSVSRSSNVYRKGYKNKGQPVLRSSISLRGERSKDSFYLCLKKLNIKK